MPRLMLLSSLALTLTLTLGAAADWPQFRGPDVSGVSSEKGLPTKWSATSGVAWKTELPGPGSSSPVFIGDRTSHQLVRPLAGGEIAVAPPFA